MFEADRKTKINIQGFKLIILKKDSKQTSLKTDIVDHMQSVCCVYWR